MDLLFLFSFCSALFECTFFYQYCFVSLIFFKATFLGFIILPILWLIFTNINGADFLFSHFLYFLNFFQYEWHERQRWRYRQTQTDRQTGFSSPVFPSLNAQNSPGQVHLEPEAGNPVQISHVKCQRTSGIITAPQGMLKQGERLRSQPVLSQKDMGHKHFKSS